MWKDALGGLLRHFHSPLLCVVEDVMRRYTMLLPFFKMNVGFYVQECEGRAIHGGGLCSLHLKKYISPRIIICVGEK